MVVDTTFPPKEKVALLDFFVTKFVVFGTRDGAETVGIIIGAWAVVFFLKRKQEKTNTRINSIKKVDENFFIFIKVL